MSTMKGVGTRVLAMLGVVLALSVAGLPLAESQRQYDAGLDFLFSRGLTAGTLSFRKGSFSAKCAWTGAVVGHAFQPRSRIGGRQNKLHSPLFELATAGIKPIRHDLLTANSK